MWDGAVWKVKGWLGIKPPTPLLGDICVSPPTAATNTLTSQKTVALR
jgi:hypothetical protein